MSDTVSVAVLTNDEGEPCWLATNTQGYVDPHYGRIEIPAESWKKFHAATKTIDAVVSEAISLSIRDEQGRLKHPCAEYAGYHTEARTWWSIVFASDGTGETWPASRGVALSPHIDTEAEAEELLANLQAMPGVPMISGYPANIIEIDPARLSVERSGFPDRWTDCETCGWDHDSHRFQQQTIDSPADSSVRSEGSSE